MQHLFSELSEVVIVKILHRFCAEAARVLFCIALYVDFKELLVFVTPAYMVDTPCWTIQVLWSLCTPQDRGNG